MERPLEKYTREEAINFVSIALLKRGFVVSIIPKNRRFNILCKNTDNTKSAKIRVTKSKHSMSTWTLNEINESYSDNFFYVFVGHKSLKTKEFFIIPSKTVSVYIKENAEKWLSAKRRDGKPHKDINTRKFIIGDDESKKYLNNWDLLGL